MEGLQGGRSSCTAIHRQHHATLLQRARLSVELYTFRVLEALYMLLLLFLELPDTLMKQWYTHGIPS
ncbi:hypothetical protein DPMN_037355 [Dreissena polymorpha]|uniref:Uncharacterized protein n=1 Tax=Dreissena polymorpha TaxID=45954 RepID=A0A9D4MDC6_DREPO|nr:hypothetical protein DPMN_037355 [Dreissena polymorpha]